MGNPVQSTPVGLGEGIFLSAAKSTKGNDPNSTKWIVFPQERAERCLATDNGNTLVILAGNKPTTITVILAVALDNKVSVAQVSIKVGGGDNPVPPQPSPTPTPTPTPTPSVPIPSDATPEEIAAVSSIYELQAQQVGAGAIRDANTLYYNTAQEMLDRLGRQRTIAWIPWRDKMNEKLLAELNPRSIQDYANMWLVIANSLKGK